MYLVQIGQHYKLGNENMLEDNYTFCIWNSKSYTPTVTTIVKL